MSMLRINQLKMYQIGSFGHLTLDFPEKLKELKDKAEIHILTGENGTGKTTILEVMAALIQPDQLSGFSHKLRTPNEYDFKLKMNSSETLEIVKRLGSSYSKTNLIVSNRYLIPFNEYPRKPFSLAFFAYSGHRRFDHSDIQGIKEIGTNPFENALDFQKSIGHENILQWIANNIAKSLLAKGKGNSTLAKSYLDTVEKLKDAIGSIIQKKIDFDIDESDLKVWIVVGGEKLEFNQLPDGLKSIISWIADLLMRMDRVKWENDTSVFDRNFILFLDEIEVHLHPAWQRKVLPVVQKLFPNAQIFISTHSPFVVGSVDGAWIHKLVKPNGDSKLAEGYPKLSEDGNSFRYWLDEVFDVSAEFGIGAENQLKEFYALRDEVLKSNDENLNKKLLSKGRELAEQSTELHQIIEMELRQLNRRKSLSLSI